MDFQRILLGNLKGWRKSPYRKPLVLRGARQVGKTTVKKNSAQNLILSFT